MFHSVGRECFIAMMSLAWMNKTLQWPHRLFWIVLLSCGWGSSCARVTFFRGTLASALHQMSPPLKSWSFESFFDSTVRKACVLREASPAHHHPGVRGFGAEAEQAEDLTEQVDRAVYIEDSNAVGCCFGSNWTYRKWFNRKSWGQKNSHTHNIFMLLLYFLSWKLLDGQ